MTSKDEVSSFVSTLQSKIAGASIKSNAEDKSVFLSAILRGGFSLIVNPNIWQSTIPRNSIYVSASALDSQEELSILFDELFPELRKKARLGGVDFSLTNFDTLSPCTEADWLDLLQEVQDCNIMSTGVFFLSLAFEDYGRVILPPTVDPKTFFLEGRSMPARVKELIDKYYPMDTNSLPPRHRLLQGEAALDGTYTDPQLQELKTELSHLLETHSIGDSLIPREDVVEHEAHYFIGQSTQEWVTKHAMSDPADQHRCYFIGKVFLHSHRIHEHEDRSHFIKIDALSSWIRHKLSVKNSIKVDTCLSHEQFKSGDYSWKSLWKALVGTMLSQSVDEATALKGHWDERGCGRGLTGALAEEMLFHSHLAYIHNSTFAGRRELVDRAMTMLNRPNCTDKARPTALRGVSFAVTGLSGTGKSALMAKLADLVYRTQTIDRPVIIRFCGTTEHSRAGVALLRGLCHQITFALGKPLDESIATLPYSKVVKIFQLLLQENAVVLFIDGIDTMRNDDLFRSDLTFLRGFIPHENTRVVVSTIPDDIRGHSHEWVNCYGSESKLLAGKVPVLPVQKFDVSDSSSCEDAKAILFSHLAKSSRVISEAQWDVVLSRLGSEPTALYLTIVAAITATWPSFNKENALRAFVRPTTNQLFDMFEASVGRMFVRIMFGIISLSLFGVSEAELLDIASLVDPLLDEVCSEGRFSRVQRYHWSRLYHKSKALLVRGTDGYFRWIHTSFKKATLERLEPEELQTIRVAMATYFGNLVPAALQTERHILDQPMLLNFSESVSVWLPSAKINARRCIEAPCHMIAAGMLDEAVRELCDIESVCARVKVGDGHSLVFYLAEVAHKLDNLRVYHYLRWVRRYVENYSTDPSQNLVLTALAQPMSSGVRKDMMDVVAKYHIIPNFSQSCWIRAKEFGGLQEFDDLMAVFTGHDKIVLTVDISQDGRHIVSGSEDHALKVWDAYTGVVIHAFEGHNGAVYAACFSADGKLIASGSRDKSVRIWDACLGLSLHVLSDHSDAVTGVCFNSTSTLLASSSRDRTVKLWDVATGVIRSTLDGHGGVVTCVCFCGEVGLLAGCEDDTIRLWNPTTGLLTSTFESHTKAVTSISATQDGRKFVSASRDKTIRLWEVSSGSVLSVLERHSNRVASVSISGDGSKIVSACDDNHILLWDADTNEVIKSYAHQPVTQVKFCVDGKSFVSGSFVKTVNLWNIYYGHHEGNQLENLHSVTSLCFSPDNKQLVSGNLENSIRIWNCESGQLTASIDAHDQPITTIATTGRYIVSGSADHMVAVWDAGSLSSVTVFENDAAVSAVSISPMGDKIVIATEDKLLKILDFPSWEKKAFFREHTDVVLCVAFNHDGTKVVSGGDDNWVIIWDVASQNYLHVCRGHKNRVNCVAFTALGLYVASGSADKTIRLWSVREGTMHKVLSGHTIAVLSLVTGADDCTLVSSSVDKTVRVWNSYTGEAVNVLSGHTGKVTTVAISADGHLIASGSADKTVRLWDASSGVERESPVID